MNPLCDFCEERKEGETIFEGPNKKLHICERCVVRAYWFLWKEALLTSFRERLWANISGIAALLGLLLIVLAACAACQGKTPGCPPLPFSYEPQP